MRVSNSVNETPGLYPSHLLAVTDADLPMTATDYARAAGLVILQELVAVVQSHAESFKLLVGQRFQIVAQPAMRQLDD